MWLFLFCKRLVWLKLYQSNLLIQKMEIDIISSKYVGTSYKNNSPKLGELHIKCCEVYLCQKSLC